MKDYIKLLVKESLGGLLREKGKTPDKEGENTENSSKAKDDENIDYSDVKNFFDKHNSITKVGVFREAGFSKDDIYSRLPYKKLDKDKNEDGGVYSFNKDEIDRIRTVIDKYPGGD